MWHVNLNGWWMSVIFCLLTKSTITFHTIPYIFPLWSGLFLSLDFCAVVIRNLNWKRVYITGKAYVLSVEIYRMARKWKWNLISSAYVSLSLVLLTVEKNKSPQENETECVQCSGNVLTAGGSISLEKRIRIRSRANRVALDLFSSERIENFASQISTIDFYSYFSGKCFFLCSWAFASRSVC